MWKPHLMVVSKSPRNSSYVQTKGKSSASMAIKERVLSKARRVASVCDSGETFFEHWVSIRFFTYSCSLEAKYGERVSSNYSWLNLIDICLLYDLPGERVLRPESSFLLCILQRF